MAKRNDSSGVGECLNQIDSSQEKSQKVAKRVDDLAMETSMKRKEDSKEKLTEVPVGMLVDIKKENQSEKYASPSGTEKETREPMELCGASRSGRGSEPDEELSIYPLSKLNRVPACHMELDKLYPSPQHTVLINVNRFYSHGELATYDKGQQTWDSNHVKMPYASPPGSNRHSRWDVISKHLQHLSKGSPSVGDVECAIMSYNEHYKKDWSFDALREFVMRIPKEENDFITVIPKIAKLALQLPSYLRMAVPLLQRNQRHSITMSQYQIACLLANAFFCTFPHRNNTKQGSEFGNYPTINFSSLFGNTSMRKTEKLRAIFHYFNTVTNEATRPSGLVTIERCCIPVLPNWKNQQETLRKLHITSKGSIEKDGEGMLQVDFACNMVGGGVLGSGLVQEEILFLMNPELIVARLFTEKLDNHECLKITGSQQYSLYSGYSSSFEWAGPCTDHTRRDEWKRRHRQIVAIDAINFKHPNEQYTKINVTRELNKAYCGFKGDGQTPSEYLPSIATGNWGCGAFNGDPKLKALIQLMAAAVVNRDMAYFTFGDSHLALEVQHLHRHLTTHKVTVGKLYQILNDYCEKRESNIRRNPGDLYEFIVKNTSPKKVISLL